MDYQEDLDRVAVGELMELVRIVLVGLIQSNKTY